MIATHGIGGRQDLPIPFSYALAGAALALIASFVILALAWRESRYRGDDAGHPLPGWLAQVADAAATRWVLQAGGLVAFGYVVLAMFAGPDLATNPTPGVVYVLVWIGLVPASLAFGPVWRLISPFRTIHLLLSKAVRLDPREGSRRLPPALGLWPAAVGLFAFTWLELVAPDRATLPVLRIAFAGYAAAMLIGGTVFGSTWFSRADPFEVYSDLFARLSWLGRRSDGRLVARRPLENLDGLRARAGLTAVVAVLLGSTAYDSASNAPWWLRWAQSTGLGPTLTGTLGLLAFVLIVYLTFTAATVLAGGLAGGVGGGVAGGPTGVDPPSARRALPTRFAHSVVPIVLGYLVAHYFTLLVLEGQRTLVLLSDPLGSGADYLGTGGWEPNRWITGQPTLVATIQVGAVVAGHVLGVISAHDRAVRLFPRRTALLGQLPLLAVMVGYTVGGLLLLFGG